jgi:alpha-L-rhamnosidase
MSSRRDFVRQSILGSTALALAAKLSAETPEAKLSPAFTLAAPVELNLAPAKWIWLPAGRTLPNSVIFFRKNINLKAKPVSAKGWILGETRYRLWCNGAQLQFGPAPYDPRWPEADPLDLSTQLQAGANTLGAEVLYYGHGDGTAPIGKPGFIFKLEIEYADSSTEMLVSDETWSCKIARAWPAGQYKRWYLRSFQEQFDARLYPLAWCTNAYRTDASWLKVALTGGSPDKPALATWAPDYMYDTSSDEPKASIRARSIPMMRHEVLQPARLAEQFVLNWKIPVREYFDFNLAVDQSVNIRTIKPLAWKKGQTLELDLKTGEAQLLTFEFAEQGVGFPYLKIEAPAGLSIELLVHEAHEVGGPKPILNTHFHSWTRFLCKKGLNSFETFDFESLKWLQLHLHGAAGKVRIIDLGYRRRIYPFPATAMIKVSDERIQKLMDASVNTMLNSCQETIVDGMARERQQYSGDCGHQILPLFQVFNDKQLPARYLTTYSQGLTKEGYFLDTWPAFDRLARLMERQLNMSPWGPVLDHSVGFVFDCWNYYLHTGELDAVKEPFPRLITLFNYFQKQVAADELLPVENLGVPYVWIDHNAYQKQRHKHCVFNLYLVAMLKNAFSPLAKAFGEKTIAEQAEAFGQKILRATQAKYWSESEGLFVCNQPWRAEEGGPRLDDRSLATAILYDLCPDGKTAPSIAALDKYPANLGLAYPANTIWRYWAMAKSGKILPLLNEWREKWWNEISSIQLNNTLAEDWNMKPDSNAQWSHCPIGPLAVFCSHIAGIQPLSPGYAETLIQPQLGDLPSLKFSGHTPKGPIELDLQQKNGHISGKIKVPSGVKATLSANGQKRLLSEGWNELG